MKTDTTHYLSAAADAGETARRAEAAGFDGWWTTETQVDPFLACAVAAQSTQNIGLGTAIAIAFARSPMTVAYQANDLQALSGGRFVLGLGSQIRTHVEKRFSMPWSRPAARMREFVSAVRAIWDAWATGQKLDFRGDFYLHTLMTPFFDPGPNPHGPPPIMLAGVGPLMTEAAGEVADGFFCHLFSTERYVREVTLPALRRGRAKAGKGMDGFQIAAPGVVVASEDEEELAAGVRKVKQQIAFYGSTPAYRPVLELHGWGDLQDELNAMTKAGRWDDIADLIDDAMVDAFAVVGTPQEAVAEVRRRYGDVAARIGVAPEGLSADVWAALPAALRSETFQSVKTPN
jgi:probable F420-dependent oxidoreductase